MTTGLCHGMDGTGTGEEGQELLMQFNVLDVSQAQWQLVGKDDHCHCSQRYVISYNHAECLER